jgi:malate dehydrogenase
VGLIFSFPISNDGEGGYEIVEGLEWSDFAKEKVMITQEELRNEKSLVLDLLP